MPATIQTQLRKMSTKLDANNEVIYSLPSVSGVTTLNNAPHNDDINLNNFIGSEVTLKITGSIVCIGCGETTEKSHAQGFCSSCNATLARCDTCSIKPEKCHYHENTCREPSWGEENCLKSHIVYLSYTSGFKVGITKEKNIPQRWIDQGARIAVPLFRVSERLVSGLVEEAFKDFVNDKTNWRTMLMDDDMPSHEEMLNKAQELCTLAKSAVDNIRLRFGCDAIEPLVNATPQEIVYPVPAKRPFEKVGMPHNLDKKPEMSGLFHGIKGQYLYIGTSVVNLRKYAGYTVEFTT